MDRRVVAMLVSMGGPTMYARVLEWRGRPDADLLWASEAEVLDDLATRRLIVPHELPDSLLREVPTTLGEPRPIPLRDSKGFWVGTALTAAGIIYHPRLLRRLGVEPPRDWDDLYLLSDEGQRVMTGHGLFPIVPKFKMEGPPGSVAAQAVAFSGMRSFFDRPARTIYDDDLAQKRYAEVNEVYRKLITERHPQLVKMHCP